MTAPVFSFAIHRLGRLSPAVAAAVVLLSAAPSTSAVGAPIRALRPTVGLARPCPAGAGAPAGHAPILSLDPRAHAPRVFAIQFKQDAAQVRSYASFARAIDCLVRGWVLPHMAVDRPNVVVFDEDAGLLTLATGSRGAATRRLLASATAPPACRGQSPPCATLAMLASVNAGYARQIDYYKRRFPGLNALSASFIAATDTFARGVMQTFSDLARRYGLYVIASNTQARFRVSTQKADIAALADPDRPRPPFV